MRNAPSTTTTTAGSENTENIDPALTDAEMQKPAPPPNLRQILYGDQERIP